MPLIYYSWNIEITLKFFSDNTLISWFTVTWIQIINNFYLNTDSKIGKYGYVQVE